MHLIDLGTGPPIIVIPGIQGRWEWMKPGIEALAARCRVITFSLCDEPSCQGAFDAGHGFSCYVEQVREAMDEAGVERASICGVSYGGLIAAAFAARYPERAASLVLLSALPPSWTPDARVRFYLRTPRLLTPLFMIASLRMYREIAAAYRGRLAGLRPSIEHGWNVLTHMFSPTRMARRVRLLEDADFSGIGDVEAPTLVVTGDPHLDRVVPVRATREYLRVLPHARLVTVEHTGHLGFITRPDAFAGVITSFVNDTDAARSRRRIG
jgi:3-oxoadipate enol-lactonase